MSFNSKLRTWERLNECPDEDERTPEEVEQDEESQRETDLDNAIHKHEVEYE